MRSCRASFRTPVSSTKTGVSAVAFSHKSTSVRHAGIRPGDASRRPVTQVSVECPSFFQDANMRSTPPSLLFESMPSYKMSF
jgi:hypothetical protein